MKENFFSYDDSSSSASLSETEEDPDAPKPAAEGYIPLEDSSE